MKSQQHFSLDLKIIDDFLDDDYHNQILTLLDGCVFPWYYQKTLTHGCNDIQAHGFNHWLSSESDPEFCTLVEMMQSYLNAKECLRVRADMTLYNPQGYRHSFHVDSQEPHTVCIYYVNNSDGDTIILGDNGNLERVAPKANRLIVFNGRYLHTGHSPSRHKNRILINANFR